MLNLLITLIASNCVVSCRVVSVGRSYNLLPYYIYSDYRYSCGRPVNSPGFCCVEIYPCSQWGDEDKISKKQKQIEAYDIATQKFWNPHGIPTSECPTTWYQNKFDANWSTRGKKFVYENNYFHLYRYLLVYPDLNSSCKNHGYNISDKTIT